ncbi:MAG: GNAT family N-acetyltransferase [Treponema sp.]|nr:GNAT family N-acetyltransferase [Treponema sp.]
MKIKHYNVIIDLWKNSAGVGINDHDDSKYYLNKFIKRNPNTCFIAVNDKKEIIGTIIGGNDGRRGVIYHLVVKPEYRKNGIGKKLQELVENNFIKDGIRRINLFVLKDNEIGNNFWENAGYGIRDVAIFRSKKIDK